MRIPVRAFAVAVLGVAAFATASPAGAACAGSDNTIKVCATVNTGAVPTVNPTGSSYEDCIYTGGSNCTEVSVPIPTVEEGSGSVLTVSCYNQVGRKWVQCENLTVSGDTR